MENQIDEFFRERLKEAEFKVQPDSWFRLQDRMNQHQGYRRKIYAAAAMLIFTLAAGFWLLTQPADQVVESLLSDPIQVPSTIPQQKGMVKDTFSLTRENKLITEQNPKVSKSQVSDRSTGILEQTRISEHVITEEAVPETFQNFESIQTLSSVSTKMNEVKNETEVIIYELESNQVISYYEEPKGRFIKAVMDWKRDGVSFEAVRGIKNDLFNKLARLKQKSDNRELKFETTEQ